MRTNIYLIIVLSTICFSSCYREKDLKYSLNAAGKNRIELEKVLEHYKDSGPKYDAACFLIKNKKFRSGQFEKNTIRHIP